MSDSEVEFESADEGSKGDDGWDIDTDFDLPDLESNPSDKKSSVLSNTLKISDSEQNLKCSVEDVKPSGQNCDIPMLQSGLDKLTVINNDDPNSKPLISEENKIVQNEIKQSSVSTNILFSLCNVYYLKTI